MKGPFEHEKLIALDRRAESFNLVTKASIVRVSGEKALHCQAAVPGHAGAPDVLE
jgi:hypothetical protein